MKHLFIEKGIQKINIVLNLLFEAFIYTERIRETISALNLLYEALTYREQIQEINIVFNLLFETFVYRERIPETNIILNLPFEAFVYIDKVWLLLFHSFTLFWYHESLAEIHLIGNFGH